MYKWNHEKIQRKAQRPLSVFRGYLAISGHHSDLLDCPDIFSVVVVKLKTSFTFALHLSGCGPARLRRLLWEQEIAGSNPATPTNKSQLR